jgi:phage terminase large subunit-like protein
METRLARVKSGLGPRAADLTDRSPWDWYAQSCSCGLPPGDCRAHPRARMSQRPPAGDWRVWGYVAGRGAGKTRAGACWIQRRVEAGIMKLGCLIAPTMADIRDVMVEGPSGIDDNHLLREAYRNAIYSHGGVPYRVKDVGELRGKSALASCEKLT